LIISDGGRGEEGKEIKKIWKLVFYSSLKGLNNMGAKENE
jgi:hypothetical protein